MCYQKENPDTLILRVWNRHLVTAHKGKRGPSLFGVRPPKETRRSGPES